MDAASSHRWFGLDLLRSAAALGVLFAHAVFFVWSLAPDWSLLLYVASVSIDAFFVLAGFLLGHAWLKPAATGSAAALLGHRGWRILPLYVLFVAVNAVLAWRADGQWPTVWPHLAFVQNLDASHGRYFPEAWNLSVWVWSLLLSCLAFAVLGRSAGRVATFALLMIVLGIVVRTGFIGALDPSWDDGIKKVVLARLDACHYGLLAAAVLARRGAPRHAGILALGGALLLASSVLAYRAGPIDTTLIPRLLPFVASGAGWALCLPWLLSLRAADGAFSRAVTWLASASYALYLVHFPLIRLIERDWRPATEWTHGALHVAGYVGLALLSAAVLHRLLDRPLRSRGFWARA